MVLEVLVPVSEIQSHVFKAFDEDVWTCKKTPAFWNHSNSFFFSFFYPIMTTKQKKRERPSLCTKTLTNLKLHVIKLFKKSHSHLKRKRRKGLFSWPKNRYHWRAWVWTAHLRNAVRGQELKSADRDVFGFSKTKHKSTVGWLAEQTHVFFRAQESITNGPKNLL